MTDARLYIEERSIPEPNTGCWLWLLSVGSHGYGNATSRARRVDVAHRVSYEAFVGPIPDGMLVHHSCDNKLCVAPHHLSLGTDATNAADRCRKGRSAHKLTVQDVLVIRVSAESQRATAKAFGLDQQTVWAIRHRIVWRHIP